MTLLSWLTLFLAASLAAVAILAVVLGYRTQTRWMRIFSEKQGIPAIIMENKAEPTKPAPKLDSRPRIHVPVPGMDMFKPRKTQ